ncbi:MAG TPA: molybdopterin-dependent oxidoreductase, partial [Miltoncostaeaceae bacterium]|nr:molybdopterin-dependent oxidoreductase [Miltoncostaeaceae bacterium]
DRLLPATPEDALARAAEALRSVKQAAGANAIAVLGSPLATNEEAYLLARLAREVIGTPHIDFSSGPIHRAVADALTGAFGTHRLPAALDTIEHARTIVVLAGDLEESHNVASLRIKDAVVKRDAKLVVISNRWNELVPFAAAWLQPRPGAEAHAAQALADAMAGHDPSVPPGVDDAALRAAIEAARAGDAADGGFAVVFAPDSVGAAKAGNEARALANLAIAARGEQAAACLHYLPTDANVNGIADMGIAPDARGMSFPQIVQAAKAGDIKALVVHDDNPLLNAPGMADTLDALEALEALVVIDSVRSTTAEFATVLLAELPFHAKDGTLTNADYHLYRQRPAANPQRDERDGVAIISALAGALGGAFSYDGPAAVMREAAQTIPGYVTHEAQATAPGHTRVLPAGEPVLANPQPLAPAPEPPEGLTLITGRSLFTSWEGASMRWEDADKLHREEVILVNPRDAEAAGLRIGDQAVLTDGRAEVHIAVRLDDGVAPGTVYVPHYYNGGAPMALLPLEGIEAAPATLRLRALQPA